MQLVATLRGVAGGFKIGNRLFTTEGPTLVRRIVDAGSRVFLDLKYHDIPNTVEQAVEAAVGTGVWMINVHASGGTAMMEAAARAARETSSRLGRPAPLMIGVTVLTSMDANDLAEIGIHASPAEQVERLTSLTARTDLRGLVCSPLEIVRLRQILPVEMQLVTPGIRPADAEKGDQKRTLTPAEAISAGASWLVIGRPIYAASDPCVAAEKILASLAT